MSRNCCAPGCSTFQLDILKKKKYDLLNGIRNKNFNMDTLLTITSIIEEGDSIQLVGCVDHKEEFSKAIV